MTLDWIDQPESHSARESLVRQQCFDSELDWLADDATDAQVIDRVSQEIIGKIRAYRTARGARKYLTSRWQFLLLIADHEPEIFDSILLEYAEHQTAHP